MAQSLFTGKPLGQEQPEFVKRVLAAARAAGATRVNVISGYRDPAYNAAHGGVPGSNHTRGLAMDATVTLPDGRTIPIGQLPTLARFGLRSGDQPGFYHGGRDPNHVDAGYMAQGVAPMPDPRTSPGGAAPQPYHPGQPSGVETQPYNPATQAPSWQPQQQGMFTPGQSQFIGRYAQQTGLDPRVVAAEVLNEESGSAAQKRQQAGIHNWLNIGYTDTAERGTGNQVWRDPLTAATASANWIKGRYDAPGFGRASSGVQGILRSVGQSPAAQIAAIQHSGWASSGYPNLPAVYQSVGGRLSAPAQAPPPAALAQVGPPVVGNPPLRGGQGGPPAPQQNVAARMRSGIVSALLAHGGNINPGTLLNVALNARRG
jgi:hypothetical protein